MNRGGDRQKVFLDKHDYEAFLKTADEIHDRWGIEIFAYCLMGNHYHVCLRTPEGNLSRAMQHLDGLYTQRFNLNHRRGDVLFQERYKAIKVKHLIEGKRGKENEARKVGMYLVKELCGLKLREIAERFGTGSYGAVGWACHGVKSRMESDARFRGWVDRIRRTCQQKI